jgi:hypothetical protein
MQLIQLICEQNNRIEAGQEELRTQNNRLEAQNDDLKRRLEQVESDVLRGGSRRVWTVLFSRGQG